MNSTIDDKKEKYELAYRKKILHNAREMIINKIIKPHTPPKEIDICKELLISNYTLENYATLDWDHVINIRKLITTIRSYALDTSRLRPLNIIMVSSPGSGKTHFIKCLVSNMNKYNISSVSFNMANMDNISDMLYPLDEVRNIKVSDKLPLLFLDEFDSKPNYYSLLLPLLWDGSLHIGHREIQMGKVIIILAGSSEDIIRKLHTDTNIYNIENEYNKNNQGNQTHDDNKLKDLLSRINGGEFTIPSINKEVDGSETRCVDKICITISLLQQRFGKYLQYVPWGLLKFISQIQFRYEVRSISHLIDMIPYIGKNKTIIKSDELLQIAAFQNVEEFNKSSLKHHIIITSSPELIIMKWKELLLSKELVIINELNKEYDINKNYNESKELLLNKRKMFFNNEENDNEILL